MRWPNEESLRCLAGSVKDDLLVVVFFLINNFYIYYRLKRSQFGNIGLTNTLLTLLYYFLFISMWLPKKLNYICGLIRFTLNSGTA